MSGLSLKVGAVLAVILAACGTAVAAPDAYVISQDANPSTINTAQVKIVTTGVPVQLPSYAYVNGFVVTAMASNAGVSGYDCLGPSSALTNTRDGTGNGSCKPVGSAWAFGVTNSSAVWVNGATGDVFTVDGN